MKHCNPNPFANLPLIRVCAEIVQIKSHSAIITIEILYFLLLAEARLKFMVPHAACNCYMIDSSFQYHLSP